MLTTILIIVFLVLAAAGAAAFYYFKHYRKPDNWVWVGQGRNPLVGKPKVGNAEEEEEEIDAFENEEEDKHDAFEEDEEEHGFNKKSEEE